MNVNQPCKENQSTYYTKEDWDQFFEWMKNLPEPTERLKKAAKKYKELIKP